MEKEIDWADNGPVVEYEPISTSDKLNILKTSCDKISKEAILNMKKLSGINIKREILYVELDETDKSSPKARIDLFYTFHNFQCKSTLLLNLMCAHYVKSVGFISMIRRDIELMIFDKLVDNIIKK